LHNKIFLLVDLSGPLLQFVTSHFGSWNGTALSAGYTRLSCSQCSLCVYRSIPGRPGLLQIRVTMYRKVCTSSLPLMCNPPLPTTRLFPTQTFPVFVTFRFSGDTLMVMFKAFKIKINSYTVAYRGGVCGVQTPPSPRNSEVLTKLSRIPSFVENTSVTT
jgi:hypothetical protein